MKKWIITVIVVVVLVLIGISLNQKDDSSIIKIGFVGPLTGDVSSMGQGSKVAVEIAVAEINNVGGINGKKLEVIYEDGKCNPSAASGAVQKLVNVDKVKAIIGGLCSSETSAFVKIIMDNKVPTISYCSSAPNLSQTGKYFFRTYPSDSFQGKYAAEYAYNTLGARKIAILYHISDWGTGIKDVFVKRFTELGGEIVVTEGTAQEVRDYKTQLSKIKELSPDYIYAPLYTEGALVAIQQARDLGIKTKILGADAWDDTKFVEAVNKNADIVYVSSTGETTQEFKDKMKTKLDKEVTICAPQAYDAVKALEIGLKAAGTNPDSLQEAIRKVSFIGTVGSVDFDQNGDITSAAYRVKRIQNGKSEVIVK